jgi:hypothetical protein
MQDSADHRRLAPINIEPGRQDDQIRAALQRHESRHGRAHAEFARFVIARRQHAAPLACAAHADRFAAQRRPIAHLDRSIKAIHIEMNDRAGPSLSFHISNLAVSLVRGESDAYGLGLGFPDPANDVAGASQSRAGNNTYG